MVAAADAVAADDLVWLGVGGGVDLDDEGVFVAGFEDGGAPVVAAEVVGGDPVAQEFVVGDGAVRGEVGLGAEVDAHSGFVPSGRVAGIAVFGVRPHLRGPGWFPEMGASNEPVAYSSGSKVESQTLQVISPSARTALATRMRRGQLHAQATALLLFFLAGPPRASGWR